jgi:hypothetical protein
MTPVPEIIDPVFTKTSQNARFLLSENERFGLVFVKTGSINSGTGILPPSHTMCMKKPKINNPFHFLYEFSYSFFLIIFQLIPDE